MTEKSASDVLRELLDERGVEWRESVNVANCVFTIYESPTFGEVAAMDNDGTLYFHELNGIDVTPEQAIAATLGRPKAKAHPYGYEPDTGAFDATRCECGCVNDISATYCNDCGGVIDVDMNAEKEIYHTPRHSVFAEKHDDGSLEFGGKRYVAATLGGGKLTAEQVRRCVRVGACDHGLWEAIDEDTDWQAIADELNATLGSRTCEVVQGKNGLECSKCGKELPYDPYADYEGNFCATCGARLRYGRR